MKNVTNPILPALAGSGALSIGIPCSKGGSGGDLRDLFDAVAEAARTSVATARILAAQRHFAEVLLAGENVGLAEYRLPSTLDGTLSGACTATWPEHASMPLRAEAGRAGWRVSGASLAVPNIGEAWFLATALLQADTAHPPCLVILSSEQDGILREAAASDVEGDDSAVLRARGVFFRPDEILHEDATQISSTLVRFSSFLRCAMDAGRARSALESMPAADRSLAHATLSDTVATLRSLRSPRDLPANEELRRARLRLQSLQRAT